MEHRHLCPVCHLCNLEKRRRIVNELPEEIGLARSGLNPGFTYDEIIHKGVSNQLPVQ